MNENFLFRDGDGRIYKVAWDGRRSGLYPRRPSGHWFFLRDVKDEEIETFMANEIPAEEYARYDSIVEPIGRLFFMVKSATRPEVAHIVDLEANAYGENTACSCEQNRFRKVECRHIAAVREFIGQDTSSLEAQLSRGIATRPRAVAMAA